MEFQRTDSHCQGLLEEFERAGVTEMLFGLYSAQPGVYPKLLWLYKKRAGNSYESL